MDVVQLGFADRVGLGDHREYVGVLEETIELGIVRAVPRVALLDVIDRLDVVEGAGDVLLVLRVLRGVLGERL